MSALAFNSQRVQELRRLLGRRSSRHEHGRFVVEGPVLVAEAVGAGWSVEAQFVPEGSDAAIDGARKRSVADGAWTFSRTKSSADVAPIVAASFALWAHPDTHTHAPPSID